MCSCLQYAVALTSSKLYDLQPCIKLVNSDIEKIMDWSNQSNLFNSKKMKPMLFSTPQVRKIHDLLGYSSIYALITSSKILERVKSWRVFGTIFSKNFTRHEHLKKVTQFAESFVNISNYLIKRLERVQNATAGFILQEYTTEHDVLSWAGYWFKAELYISFCSLRKNRLLHKAYPCLWEISEDQRSTCPFFKFICLNNFSLSM